jgi:putative endonuclease
MKMGGAEKSPINAIHYTILKMFMRIFITNSSPLTTYYVYILTCDFRSVLYIGITNDLRRRVQEHYENADVGSGFTGKYTAQHLIYLEEYDNPVAAIDRETQLKKWSRKKKENLIATKNPEWIFLEYMI